MIDDDVPGNLYLCLVRNNVSNCFDSGFNIFVSSDIKSLTPMLREPSLIVVLGIVTGGSTKWSSDDDLDVQRTVRSVRTAI